MPSSTKVLPEGKSKTENESDVSENGATPAAAAPAPRPNTSANTPNTDCDEHKTKKPSSPIEAMINACSSGDITHVRTLLLPPPPTHSPPPNDDGTPATKQDPRTGKSPLMAAAEAGHLHICQLLLDEGAPWNAVDRRGNCAGDLATRAGHWRVVDLLVDAGTRAELVLGAAVRLGMQRRGGGGRGGGGGEAGGAVPVEHQPCTKPTYLQHSVRYNASRTALLDGDGDAVMMEWERPLMDAHASVVTHNSQRHKRILNVGFGMGIVDSAIQALRPSQHVIIEAHPTVHADMLKQGWPGKDNVDVRFGKWQDVVHVLLQEGMQFDGIFYDTYGEHFTDLEDFHAVMAKLLAKPHGVYSFFNGLAPDNLFFHGVACQCVKLQLAKLGLDSEFAPCDIQVDESNWDGVRRKYWHGNTYYLPIVTWNKEFLSSPPPTDPPAKKQKLPDDSAPTS